MYAEQYGEFLEANRCENSDERYLRLRELLDALPDCNYDTLKLLMQHLNRVALHQDENKVCSLTVSLTVQLYIFSVFVVYLQMLAVHSTLCPK